MPHLSGYPYSNLFHSLIKVSTNVSTNFPEKSTLHFIQRCMQKKKKNYNAFCNFDSFILSATPSVL